MKNKTLVFPVEEKKGWTVTFTYIEGRSSPVIEGKDDKGNPLPKEVLDNMRFILKPGSEE